MTNASPAFSRIGKYEIQRELARGGFGRVFLALDPSVRRLVAIKVLTQSDRDVQARFKSEAEAAGNLRHKNIVTIYDFGEHERQPFLVMEFLEGHTLQEVISQHQNFSVLQRMDMMCQVADGLHCAHEGGVVHRDIKPLNIMLLPDNTIKIMDFGLARTMGQDAARLTQRGFLIGTLRYMAPEQFGGVEADALSDIFAYGVVYYELLTGKYPFEGPDAASIMYKITSQDPAVIGESMPDCPEALQQIVMRALAKDRNRRYQSIEELQFDTQPLRAALRRKRAEELLQEVNAHVGSERLERAANLLREVLELDPSNQEALLLRSGLQRQMQHRALREKVKDGLREGTELVNQGNLSKAIQAFESVLRLDPRSGEAQLRLSRAKTLYKAQQEAARLLAEAREAQLSHNLTAALQKASEAARLDSQNIEAKDLLSEIRQEVDRRESENRWRSLIEKAESLLLVKEFDEALSILGQAEAQKPSDKTVAELRERILEDQAEYRNRLRLTEELAAARLLIRVGNFQEAVSRLESLEAEHQAGPEMQRLLGHAREQLASQKRAATIAQIQQTAKELSASGKFDQALSVLENGLHAFPGNADLLNLFDTTLASKTAADRERALNEAVEQSRNLRNKGFLPEAIHTLESAIRTIGDDPSLIELHRELRTELEAKKQAEAINTVISEARSLIEQDRPSSAVLCLKKAATQFPGEDRINNLLRVAEEHVRAQQRAHAVRTICNEVRGWVSTRDFDKALQLLADALQQFPGESSLVTLQATVVLDKAVKEKEEQFEEGRLRSERLLQEKRFEEALESIHKLVANYGVRDSLLFLKDEVTRSWKEQKRWDTARKTAEEARELIRQNRPQDAIRVLREAPVDVTTDPELSSLIKVAEGALASRDKCEFIRRKVLQVNNLDAAKDWENALRVLNEGLQRFPDSEELISAAQRIRLNIANRDREQDISEQCAEIEASIEQRNWVQGLNLILEALNKYGQEPRFTSLQARIEAMQTEQERGECKAIYNCLDRAQEQERKGDLEGALLILEQGLRNRPNACELAQAVARVRELILEQNLQRKLFERVDRIKDQLSSKQWREAARLISKAQEDFGNRSVFDELAGSVEAGEAAQVAEESRKVRAILNRARELVAQQQLGLALECLDDAGEQHPESVEISEMRADLARRTATQKKQQRIAQQTAAIEQLLADCEIDRAIDLAEFSCREFPEESIFTQFVERSKNEQRRQTLERLIAKVRAALLSNKLKTAQSLLDAGKNYFPKEILLELLAKEVAAASDRRNKLAIAEDNLNRGRLDRAEKLCRELLTLQPDDAETISLLERISTKRGETARKLAAVRPTKRWVLWSGAGIIGIGTIIMLMVFLQPDDRPEHGEKTSSAQQPPSQWVNPNRAPDQHQKSKPPDPEPETHDRTKPKRHDNDSKSTPDSTRERNRPTPSVVTPPGPSTDPRPSPTPETSSPVIKISDYNGRRTGFIEWSGPPGHRRVIFEGGHFSEGKKSDGNVPEDPIPIRLTPTDAKLIEEPSARNNWSRFVFEADGGSARFKWEVYQPQP